MKLLYEKRVYEYLDFINPRFNVIIFYHKIKLYIYIAQKNANKFIFTEFDLMVTSIHIVVYSCRQVMSCQASLTCLVLKWIVD